MSAILLLLIGVIVTSLSALALWQTIRTSLFGWRATGSLSALKHSYHHQWLHSGHFTTTKLYYPIVRFEAADGSAHSVVSELGYDSLEWAIGYPFRVRYNPANPRDATVDPLTLTWVFPGVFLIAGVVVLVAGLHALM